MYQDLQWLSSSVYNFAKHERAISADEDGRTPNHYFALDEAIAIYFISRKLAAELIKLSGKPIEVFTKELP